MATLGFSTKFPDKSRTEFITKIWNGLFENGLVRNTDYLIYLRKAQKKSGEILENFPFPDELSEFRPKIHTIRKDEKNLWIPGRKIHMVVFNRSKDRFQFVPILEVKSIQKIEISWEYEEHANIFIDERELPLSHKNVEELVINDGFDSVEHFFEWFKEGFTGRIIHWTKLRY